MPLRRLVTTTAAVLTAAGALAACGQSEEPRHAATEGVYVNTGELKYQVQISRQLTARDFEDRDYLVGLPAGAQTLGKGEEWFAVFIRVFNSTKAPHPSAQKFVIRDTTGKEFQPVALDTAVNRVAYRPEVVHGGDQIPVPGSLARENLTQGGMILFKVPSASYANRPLELHIAPPEGGAEATVDLDV
ncbi:MAG TPA: hypothetical protein VK501_15145 [Baekduia sp.]|uniref:hypothetical protein n=1 Tax=Baekduia sp. TaxID=2600305 RepID=UPI002D0929B9|nr:hypothetical protein [Baekduia sp.]HMJ35245.1 hypothetical protein [Baekduia sp.]